MKRTNLTLQHVFSALCVAEHIKYTRDRDDKTDYNPWSEYEGGHGSINLKDLIGALGVVIDDQYHKYLDTQVNPEAAFDGLPYDYEIIPALVDHIGGNVIASTLTLFTHGDRDLSLECFKAHSRIEQLVATQLFKLALRNLTAYGDDVRKKAAESEEKLVARVSKAKLKAVAANADADRLVQTLATLKANNKYLLKSLVI